MTKTSKRSAAVGVLGDMEEKIIWTEGGTIIDGQPAAEITGELGGVRVTGRYLPKLPGAAAKAEAIRRAIASGWLFSVGDSGTHWHLERVRSGHPRSQRARTYDTHSIVTDVYELAAQDPAAD